ncbi:MAG: hypothetical protein GX568_02275 [Candidatus Gastranaerophilales bacterium]|nr:hypothetical protein [Candidatus Gastranaerophilales bacterium]
MSTISTNLIGSTNAGQNQLFADVKKIAAQQDYQRASSELTKVQSIFSKANYDFSSVQSSYQVSIFEKQLKEVAHKSVQDNLSMLRRKEKSLTNTQEISSAKFVKHEEKLRSNPEIVEIENNIKTNKTTIQAKQQDLDKKTAATEAYKAIVQKSADLNNKINLLLSNESTLASEIESIKTQIAQLKSSSATVSKVQASITGSESTTAIDTSKSADAEIAIAAGGQQSAPNKEINDSLKATIQDASRKQEEFDAKIREASIASLEELLEQKQQQLSTTRDQIASKQEQLAKNEELVQASKQENEENIAQRDALAAEIETLTEETDALVKARIEKDPEAVRFSAVSTLFNAVLQGSPKTGVGVKAELERTKAEADKTQNKYEDKTSQAESLKEIFDVKNFLKNTAKSSLEKSKSKTEEQKKFIESLNIAA